MPQPLLTQVHIDAPLTNISVAYMQSEQNFIASKAFPIVPVDKKSDLYFKYDKNDWFRDEATQRADTAESTGSGYGISTAQYSCNVFAFHKDVGDQTRQNADSPLDMDRDATMFVTQRLMLKQEVKWHENYFTTGIWATDASPANKWSNYGTSDPVTDIETGKTTILRTTGYLPNTLILGYNVRRYLINHPDLVDRIKYTQQGGVVDDAALAAVFGVQRILTSKGVKATNKEAATEGYDFIGGDNALLVYSAPSAGLLAPSAGYSFMWKGVSGGLGKTVGVTMFRMPQLRADRIEGETAFDMKVVAADLGYMMNAAVA